MSEPNRWPVDTKTVKVTVDRNPFSLQDSLMLAFEEAAHKFEIEFSRLPLWDLVNFRGGIMDETIVLEIGEIEAIKK